MIYANIDGRWHKEVQAADGAITTDCGLEVPFASEWSHDEPTESLCGKCFPDAPKKQTKKAA